jgi:regulator of replication initiation timing
MSGTFSMLPKPPTPTPEPVLVTRLRMKLRKTLDENRRLRFDNTALRRELADVRHKMRRRAA